MWKRVVRLCAIVLAVLIGLLAIGYVSLLRADIPFEELERKYGSPDSKFLELGTARIHYRDRGDPSQPTLLLVHGFGASLETWEPWTRILQSRYRVVSVDLPGHGLTRVEDFDTSTRANVEFVADFARAMKLPPFTLVGNSMGGSVAWNLALSHPEVVNRLVLVDASGWEWMAHNDRGGALFKIIGSPLLRNLDKTPIIREIVSMAYADKARVTDDLVQRFVELSRAPGHRKILDDILVRSVDGKDADLQATPEKLTRIKVPTLVLWGERDEMIPVGDAEKFRRAIPGATLIVYPGSGHVPMEEAAERSAEDLLAWLQATH